MDIISILGLIGTLLSIITFFFPKEWKNKILFKIIFFFIVSILSVTIVVLTLKINRIEKISKSAEILINKKSTEFTHEGFILASLSFLEQNKKDYPESYKRAIEIFDKYNNSDNRNLESVSVSYELEGLIQGIAILSTIEED